MFLKTDEELFGAIPKRGGGLIPGNRKNRIEPADRENLKNVYAEGLRCGLATMRSKRYEVVREFWTWDDYVLAEPYDFSREKAQYIDEYKRHIHDVTDRYIEHFLDKHDGYIGAFPPYSHSIGTYHGQEMKYSHLNPRGYDCHVPEYIQNISYAYSKLNFRDKRNLAQYNSSFVSALLVLLSYLVIFAVAPTILRMVTNGTIFLALIGILTVGMASAGAWVLYRGLDHKEGKMEFSTACILFFALAVASALSLMNMRSVDWQDNILKYLTWFVIGYGAVAVLLLGKQLSDAKRAVEKFNREERLKWEKRFTELMDHDGERFHRYIRLRVLWCQYEGVSLPQQLTRLEADFSKYVNEYEKIKM